MSNNSKGGNGHPLGPHSLFILAEDGNYYCCDQTILDQADKWSSDPGQGETGKWLTSLERSNAIVAIQSPPKPAVRVVDGEAKAVLCVMLNYKMIARACDDIAQQAYDAGHKDGANGA